MPIRYLDKRGYWTVAGMKSPERPADMLMKEKIPQGCQACLNLATGEPVIRCLEDGLSLGIYEAAFLAVFAQPPLSRRLCSRYLWWSLNSVFLAPPLAPP